MASVKNHVSRYLHENAKNLKNARAVGEDLAIRWVFLLLLKDLCFLYRGQSRGGGLSLVKQWSLPIIIKGRAVATCRDGRGDAPLHFGGFRVASVPRRRAAKLALEGAHELDARALLDAQPLQPWARGKVGVREGERMSGGEGERIRRLSRGEGERAGWRGRDD